MEYNSKLPANSGYYTVGNRAFSTLRQAEVYCQDNDFNPNEMIQMNSEVATSVSTTDIPAYEYSLYQLHKILKANKEELQAITAEYDRLQKVAAGIRSTEQFSASVCLSIQQNRMLEKSAEISGLQKAINVIERLTEDSYKVHTAASRQVYKVA